MNKIGIKIVSDNFDDLFLSAVKEIKLNGDWTTPRGFKCKEIRSPQLILTNTAECLTQLKDRKLNYAYLTIEKIMYLSGKQRPKILIKYNKNMKNYINNKIGKFDGAYGDRIANNNQFEWCYNELKSDPLSRRAVITIHDATDCNHETKDSACTLSLQFLIREEKLDLIVSMRSNDILWGLCLDVPAFCFIQEVMAYWLGIERGLYIHNAASLHYYDNTENQINEIINGNLELNDRKIPKWEIKKEDFKEALNAFWREEENIRKNGGFMPTRFSTINAYLFQLKEYWDKKKKSYEVK